MNLIKYSPGLIYYRHDLDEKLLDFVTIVDGKVEFDEEELKEKNIEEETIKEIRNLKEVNNLIFSIESWGQIGVDNIFIESIDALNKNLDELKKAIK